MVVYMQRGDLHMYYSKIEDFESEVYENEGFIVFVPENEEDNVEHIIEYLNNKNIKFMGGIFPFVLNNGDKYDRGIVIKKISLFGNIKLIDMQSEQKKGYLENIEKLKNKTLIIIVDGLSLYINNFINNIYTELTTNVKYIGGGAGSLSLTRKPYVFNNEGIFIDHAVIAVMNNNIALEVELGWEKLIGPLIANKVYKNTILELNWQNPLSIYKKVVESDSNKAMTSSNFFDISKQYPFGIENINGYMVIRDPIDANEKGELICVSEVPKNSVLYVLKGDKENMVSSVKRLYEKADKIYKKHTNILCFDCISRTLFLEDKFDTMLGKIKEYDNISFDGALTIGEISSCGGKGYIEFLNKSLVVGFIMDNE